MAYDKKCRNCMHWRSHGLCEGDYEYCMRWDMSDEVEPAKTCDAFVYDATMAQEEHYTRSATAGDYSPSCPWKAEGMSIKDFI